MALPLKKYFSKFFAFQTQATDWLAIHSAAINVKMCAMAINDKVCALATFPCFCSKSYVIRFGFVLEIRWLTYNNVIFGWISSQPTTKKIAISYTQPFKVTCCRWIVAAINIPSLRTFWSFFFHVFNFSNISIHNHAAFELENNNNLLVFKTFFCFNVVVFYDIATRLDRDLQERSRGLKNKCTLSTV